MIGPMTAILLGGQVLPIVLLFLGLCSWPVPWPNWQLCLALGATIASMYPRLAAARRYRQSLCACLHASGILVLLAIQWYAFFCKTAGRPSTWKGRLYPAGGPSRNMISPREFKPT